MKNIKLFFFFLFLFAINLNLFAQSESNLNNIDETQISLSQTGDENLPVQAQNPKNIKAPSATGYFVRMILVLIIVVAAIYAFFWFVKKKGLNVKDTDDYLRRVAYLNLSPTKTVEIVTILDRGYLIGVTEDNITLLGEIDDKELINAMNVNADKKQNLKKPVNFKELLDSLLVKGDKKNFFDSTNIFGNSQNNTNEDTK